MVSLNVAVVYEALFFSEPSFTVITAIDQIATQSSKCPPFDFSCVSLLYFLHLNASVSCQWLDASYQNCFLKKTGTY